MKLKLKTKGDYRNEFIGTACNGRSVYIKGDLKGPEGFLLSAMLRLAELDAFSAWMSRAK